MNNVIRLCMSIVLVNVFISISHLRAAPVDVNHDTRPILDEIHPLEQKVVIVNYRTYFAINRRVMCNFVIVLGCRGPRRK